MTKKPDTSANAVTEKVAVLLSSYNGAKYIEEQINSVLNQVTNHQLALIIRDDGSTDNTVDIINNIKDTRIILIEGDNVGLVASTLMLLDYAYKRDYTYFSLCDQDDYWLPDKIETAIRWLRMSEQNKPLLYGSCSYTADENLKYTERTTQIKCREITFYNTAIQNFSPAHSQVMNRELVDKILQHTTDIGEIYSQDLWFTNVAAVTGSILFDNTPHVIYRIHTNNKLGYGKTRIDWLRVHISRLMRDTETNKMSRQLKDFVKHYKQYLSDEEMCEMNSFFCSQNNLVSRARYMYNTRLYRQKRIETFAFKILYILAKYNI